MIYFVTAAVLQRLLKNLKDNLKRCLDKRRAATRSGSAYSELPTCRYFEQLRFLHERTENQPTETNLNVSINSESICFNRNQSIDSTDEIGSILDDSIGVLPSPSGSIESSASGIERNFTNSSHQPNTKRQVKRKASSSSQKFPESQDAQLLNHIQEIDKQILLSLKESKQADNIDETTSYCNSLIPVLHGFSKKKMRLAKVKIGQLLFDLEFDEQYCDM